MLNVQREPVQVEAIREKSAATFHMLNYEANNNNEERTR